MDIVHHSLIGGAGAVILSSAGYEVAGVAFIAASIFPDLDVIFMLLGKRFYLQNHQGITHSLVLAPLYAALVICLPLFWLLDLVWQWPVYIASLAGLIIHILLDLSNTFRIQLLSPLIKKRYSLDAIFFIDSVTWLIIGIFYFLHVYLEVKIMMFWYPLTFVCYVFAKSLLRNKLQQQLSCDYLIPSALNPFEYYALEKAEKKLIGYTFNVLSNSKNNEFSQPYTDDKYLKLAKKSQLFRDMKNINRAFYISEVKSVKGVTQLIAQDLAIRNFGGRFAKTKISFDSQGNILNEEANI